MEGESRSPTRLCVLADQYLMANEAHTLERAVEQTGIDVSLTIVNSPVNPDLHPIDEARAINEPLGIATIRVLTDVIPRERAWSLVYAERKIAELFGETAPSLNRVHVREVSCVADGDIRHVVPSRDGSWTEFPEDIVDLVGDRCDLAVRFGFGLIKGDILDAPQFGILSFHPADIREYRGLGTPQAWLDGRETIGMTLQRLNDGIDSGEIIVYKEADVSECATLWDAYETLHEVKIGMLAEGIERLRDPSFEPTVPDSLGPYYPLDRRTRPTFAGRTLLRNIAGRVGG